MNDEFDLSQYEAVEPEKNVPKDEFDLSQYEPVEKKPFPKFKVAGLTEEEKKQRNAVEHGKTFKNFGKAVISGATAGYSELLDSTKEDPNSLFGGINLAVNEELPGSTIGKGVGALLPITAASKAVAYPLKAIAAASPYAVPALTALGDMLGLSAAGGGIGALEESAHKTKEEGKFVPPSLETVASEGAKWFAIDAGLKLLGWSGMFAKALFDKAATTGASEMEVLNEVTNKLSASDEKIAEKAMELLQKPNAIENIEGKIQEKAKQLREVPVEKKDFSKLENPESLVANVKTQLPHEIEPIEKIAEEAISEDLTTAIEEHAQRASSEKALGENIQQDIEFTKKANKKVTDELYETASKGESGKYPDYNQTATSIVNEIKNLKRFDLKLTPKGIEEAEKKLLQTLEDIGHQPVYDSHGNIVNSVKTKDVSLSQGIEVKKRGNDIINYDLKETSAQDYLKKPFSALRKDIRNGYGPKDSEARKAFELAEESFGENAEKLKRKSVEASRYSQKPEQLARLIRTPSGLADLKEVVTSNQFAQIERELLEHMKGLSEDRAKAFYREVRPSFSDKVKSLGEQIIESKAPKASPTRKVAQRDKIQNMLFDDMAHAIETGERPDKVLKLWKTQEGQQLIKHALDGNPNNKQILDYLSEQSFKDFSASIVDKEGVINFKKLDEFLKDPASVANIRMIAGDEGIQFLKQLEPLSKQVKKNEDILNNTILKGTESERAQLDKTLREKGKDRFRIAKENRAEKKKLSEQAAKEEELAAKEKEKRTLQYRADEFFNKMFGHKTKATLAGLGLWHFGPTETLAIGATVQAIEFLARSPKVHQAFRKAAINQKNPVLFIKALEELNDEMEKQ